MLAGITTIFTGMLSIVTVIMDWEFWMILLLVVGCIVVWFLHIVRLGSDTLYENLCAGLLLTEFFFFGVHPSSLFDIPAVSSILILVLFMLNKKWVLYVTAMLYVFAVIYHAVVLHTISYDMGDRNIFSLALGALVTFGSVVLAAHWINRRDAQHQWYSGLFAELKATEKQNAVFLSNVSHELRTPINMVIGISEVALGRDLSPDIRAEMNSIEMAGKRLSNQINNILDYTEIVAGTLVPEKKEYMITSVLNDLVTTTALQANLQHLEFVFDIDPKMPTVLVGDVEKISKVLKILVENSIKFTEEGGINVRIRYRPENYGINLIVDIRDTGVGMTQTQINQMYNVFYQADSGSNRLAGGLGLGLPIAKGILNAMGGFAHLDSMQQQGFHAHVVIPQGVADDRPCIALNHPEQFSIICFFHPEKYSSDEVRKYYDGLILNLVNGLGVKGYQVHDFESFLKLLQSHTFTHAFIIQSEYEKNRDYYEKLAQTLRVVVIAEQDFMLPGDSQLSLIHKPFSALSVANLLNGALSDRSFAEAQSLGRRPFTCVGIRALAVDDEEMNLVVARGVLGSYGIRVDTCLSGREAVSLCGDASYDIVFLDHMMPGFDGVETLKKIRELRSGYYQDIPIIALTANTVSGAREMFCSEGFTEFVPKPIDRTVLERVLRKVLPSSCIRYDDASAPRRVTAVEGLEPDADVEKAGQKPERHEEEKTSAPDPKADIPAEEKVALKPLPYDKLAQMGIDVELGLDYCGGDENFFREMLQMFADQSPGKREEIISLYESAHWTDYAIKVHALKSTSLTIGAETLSAQAKELEMAGKRSDVGFIKENHAALIRAYDELCALLSEL